MSTQDKAFVAAPAPAALTLAQAAQVHADRFLVLIDAEFEALKKQDLSAFEALQPEKQTLLDLLGDVALKIQQSPPGLTDATEWSEFKGLIRRCQDGHRRNETLISRQLMTIRGALQALSGGQGTEALNMYDRQGQMTQHSRRDRYNEA